MSRCDCGAGLTEQHRPGCPKLKIGISREALKAFADIQEAELLDENEQRQLQEPPVDFRTSALLLRFVATAGNSLWHGGRCVFVVSYPMVLQVVWDGECWRKLWIMRLTWEGST